MEIKTMSNWTGELASYLNVGDVVDEELANYFIDILPPRTFNSHIRQIGEPYSSVNGKATWFTLEKMPEGWTFRGACYSGECIEPLQEEIS